MKKCFKVSIRLQNDDRIEIMVRGENIPTLAKDFKGPQLTFIPNKQAEFNSFTIFTHTIKRIQYEVVTVTPFDNPVIYDVLSF